MFKCTAFIGAHLPGLLGTECIMQHVRKELGAGDTSKPAPLQASGSFLVLHELLLPHGLISASRGTVGRECETPGHANLGLPARVSHIHHCSAAN